MLIDCHTHLNVYDANNPIPLKENLERLYKSMEESGVAHSVVLSSYKVTPGRPHIDELIKTIDGDKRITLVEGLRWRGEERTDLFRMEERIRDGLVKGIKIYPGYENYAINDPSLEAAFRIAEKYDVPVMIHTGDTYSKTAKVRNAHPLLVDDVAVDFPNVKFVICHLGNPWFQDTAQVLYKNDNVYADISGLTLGDFEYQFEKYMLARVKDMIRYMGKPGKQLMFGSDWPLAGMKSYANFLRGLDLTDEQIENISWRTSAALFKIQI